MAEKHKKGDGTETTNGTTPFAAPLNMGKGLLWNPETKQYYVAIDERMFEIDELGKLKLRISNLENNQLSLRNDGIYQGNIAKPELQNLYIANHGNDSNSGTREAPLRTIQEAINRVENISAYYTIHLHENHQFDWVYSHKKWARFIFKAYGPMVDSTYPESVPANGYYRGYTAKNYPRPTVNVRTNIREPWVMRQFLECSEATLVGIRFNIYTRVESPDDGSLSGHFAGFITCTDIATLHGCIIEEKTKGVSVGSGSGAYRTDVALRAPEIRWIDSVQQNVMNLASADYTGKISVINWNYDYLQGNGQAPNHEALFKYATAIRDMTRYMKESLHGVIFDDSAKSVFGMSINWNPFQA